MENIVQLADYRKRRKAPERPVAVADIGPQYFCTRCDADEFKLGASGMVHCSHCGAVMRNILVNPS